MKACVGGAPGVVEGQRELGRCCYLSLVHIGNVHWSEFAAGWETLVSPQRSLSLALEAARV